MPALLPCASIEGADEAARHVDGMVVADRGADNHEILENERCGGDVDLTDADAPIVLLFRSIVPPAAKSEHSWPERASSASSRPSSTPWKMRVWQGLFGLGVGSCQYDTPRQISECC